jgi:hypothetical protein
MIEMAELYITQHNDRNVRRDRLLFRNNGLNDKDKIVQRDAIRALGILGDPIAVEPLIGAMKGEAVWPMRRV